jgi:CRP-like cAMP-binding protein
MGPHFDKDILSNYHPLSLIDEQYIELLNASCQLKEAGANDIILRKPFADDVYHYLLEGSVEVRASFESRETVNKADTKAGYPLEENLTQGGVVKSLGSSQCLVVSKDAIDRLLTLSQSESHKKNSSGIAQPIVSEGVMIDEDFETQWTGRFFQSRLASHLSTSVLQELFLKLEDVEFAKGEIIVEKNSPGDYFYIVKSGVAQVLTEPRGPYQGQSFELTAGDYFGDEALIADTVRNATVIMITDGLLGCLQVEPFNCLIKQNLVIPLSGESNENTDRFKYVDVRLPLEYRHAHFEGAENIPISHLRKKMDYFNFNDTYVITADGGRRSELATYLLRQAGINSFYEPNNTRL